MSKYKVVGKKHRITLPKNKSNINRSVQERHVLLQVAMSLRPLTSPYTNILTYGQIGECAPTFMTFPGYQLVVYSLRLTLTLRDMEHNMVIAHVQV